ncbi:biotin carboxylase N-terminal domain-containing protein [Alcanivorax sp. DP30]|uniref:acetyl/propionyl/methylcrotonyl-CoA carboxylase subunit alpha n=1 Tax=Alcanivorax sp. DP30 TaxID=2606217 RepID=UPI00136A3EAE|nr:biotin carboxylase N-terminal domain-containing protein [Alcanivorax sp. DP30]MZR61659.1 ATP-grasp domain-containing protein [Alcanivorax sp. DP30]
MATIKKLLIANRGEIARRIMRTCREQGIATVAVYSEVDASLPHVREADQAVCLGPAPARESYLVIDKIINAARETGADAIHPGYGFLSENTELAAACDKAGIIFVGPNARAIEVMGDKAAARQLMAASQVPVLPGFDEDGATDDALTQASANVGFPLLIKAVAGGGGKGMRVVNTANEFAESLAAARREARNAFGDDRVLLERYLPTARHVEVQVFADNHGNAVHLFERDCSVQRRHQKIIEEAPAPGLDEATRNAFGEAAVQAAKAIDYRGAGTVEFLYAPATGEFFFMEMNTRLQVEHPVTEMITGEDLVAWQLAVAADKQLPKSQDQIQRCGHAMEVRLYAENPEQGFLPSSGLLEHLRWPHELARVDAGYESGDRVEEYYDPMIAKLICFGDDRDAARQKLIRALQSLELNGIHHNAPFLLRVLADDAFEQAELDTRLLEHRPQLMEPSKTDPALLAIAASRILATRNPADSSPWQRLAGWRAAGQHFQMSLLQVDDQCLSVREEDGRVSVGEQSHSLICTLDEASFSLHWGHHGLQGRFHIIDADSLLLFVDGQAHCIARNPSRDSAQQGAQGGFVAPMSGTIVALHVEPGSTVAAGDAVITLEAMKMEHTLRATEIGTVHDFHVAAGDSVSEGTLLVEFEATADA